MDDRELKRRRAYANRRSIMDIGMGIIYGGVGLVIAFADKFGLNLDFPPKPFSYIFGGLCLLYAGFRIYRGGAEKLFY